MADAPEQALDRILEWFDELLRASGNPASRVCGVGVAFPGPVAVATGRPAQPSTLPSWDEFDIPAYVQRRFDVPVLVDNDANLMALGECLQNCPSCPAHVLVKVSAGIGAGIVVDGQLRRGVDGSAGDIGHVGIDGYDDVRCLCGSYGCLAAAASSPALARRMQAWGLPADSGSSVRAALADGDARVARMVREAGGLVGGVLAPIICALNPGVLTVAGDLAEPQFVTGVRELIYRRVLPRATRNLQITTSTLGDYPGLIGASAAVVDLLYAPDAVDARLAAVDGAGGGSGYGQKVTTPVSSS